MTPRATMRLQFHKRFTFADAERLVPYFARLGVSHIYASPVTTARPGSVHGYDVIEYGIVYDTVRDDLPALVRQLDVILRPSA